VAADGVQVSAPAAARRAPRASRRRRLARALAPLPWLAPSLLLIGGVVVYPVIEMVRTSLTDVNLSGLSTRDVGLRNFRWVVEEDGFGQVLRNTGVWVVLVVGITVLVSLALAQLLNERFPGRRIVRWALIVPWATSLVMTAAVWKWMLNYYYGILNGALGWVGIIDEPIDWLGDPATSFYAMVLVGVIVSIPFTTYVVLAGLQGIPRELYEAARVDGAGSWRTYRTIVLPLLRPALLVGVVLNVIYVFNSFPIIWIMTQGGPGRETDTTVTLVYKLAFRDRAIDEAAALSVFNVIALLIVVGAYVAVVGRRSREVQL
jgi:ABC-type sugar transport system permease subunit